MGSGGRAALGAGDGNQESGLKACSGLDAVTTFKGICEVCG